MKRHLLIIAVCLLLGAVVNVAVAWGLSAVSGPAFCCRIAADEIGAIMSKQSLVDWNHQPEISGYRYRGFGRERIVLRDGVFRRFTDTHNELGAEIAMGELRVSSYFAFLTREICGWPYGSLLAEQRREWSTERLAYDYRLLSYAPIWPGFTLNTFFYAAILWLLIPGPFALRGFLRVRGGLCPKCAYPMGESAICSECGITLPRRRRMPNLT